MAKALNRKVTIYIDGREVRSTLQSLEGEMRKLQAQQKKMVIGSDEYVRTSLKIRELNSVIDAQRRAVKGLGDEWSATGNKASNIGNVVTGLQSAYTMVTRLTSAVKDLGDEAARLDDVYGKVRKTTGFTQDQVESLNEAFKKMDTRTSREQLNMLAYQAGKLGINTEESVKQFVEAADVINIALGDVLGNDAVLEISKMANVFASSTKELENADVKGKLMAIGSVINQLGKESTASETYLVDFMGRLGGVASMAGITADQVAGYASALDQARQRVELSASAFTRLIQNMIKKPESFVRAAQMPLQEFEKLIAEDMNSAILRVLEGMHKMGDFQDLVPIFQDMGLDGVRASQAIAALAENLDKVRVAQASASAEIGKATSMLVEYDRMQNTQQARLDKLKKKLYDARVALGDELYPVLVAGTNVVTGFFSALGNMFKVLTSNKAVMVGLIAVMTNWVRVKTMSLIASGKLQASMKSMLGISKMEAHQMDVNTAKELKATAAKEQEKLATIQNQLAIERENLARQKSKVGMEAQSMVTVAETRVKQLEVAATNQATVATNANTAAVKAQKAAFASTPWGLIITALTTIAGIVVGIVRNSEKWKLNQTLKEVAKQAGEAEGRVKVLFDRLQDATAGSEEYRKALEELKAEYPDLIAKHVDEEGKIKDLTAAYNDLAAAARQSVYDRMFQEKAGELQGELAEQLRKTLNGVSNWVDRYMSKMSEAERDAVRAQMNTIVRSFAEGQFTMEEALNRMNKVMVKARGLEEGAVVTYTGLLSGLNDKMRENERMMKRLKAELGANELDPFGVQKMSLQELEAELNKYLDMMDHGFSEGAERDAARLKAYREQIAKLKAEQKNATTTTTTTVTGETDKERKEREKLEKAQAKAEAAWTRFSNSYEQAMSKINAKTLSGIEAIGAEIDATTQKMRTDLKAVDKTLHPEAAQMLKDLETNAEEWKRAKIDEYIAKTNKELDKLAKSAAKTGDGKQIDKVRKATADLEEKLHSIDDAILQLTFDQAALFSKTDEASVRQLHDINEQIEAYKRLRQAMVASVFAEIAPEAKRPFKKQEDNRVSLSYQENYTRALTATQAEVEKYAKALEDALAAEQEMARVARENGNLEEAEKHEKNAEDIQHETENLEELNDEAKKLAKEDAMSKTLDKWAEMMEEFGSKALSIFSNINTMLKNQAQQRLNDLEDEKDDQIKVLDQQFEQGLISEEQYNTRKQELEDNYKAQALEAEKEDWRRQKAYGYSEAIINAAVAATKLWAGEGTTAYKIAMSALLAAEMATQIAAIESQPEPRAKGGYVNNNRLYRVGERGREWIASNSLLTNPTTAPLIQALEAYQRGNTRALGDIPMARLNMPVALAAARELGSRTTGSGSTGRMTASKGDEMLKVMTELASYLEDPKNRQAIISHRTQTDFSNNDSFLYNHARLG